MAYKLHYSDYVTTQGPPDPAEWVGPQGPPGPPGPPGAPGPPGSLSGGTITGPLNVIATGTTASRSLQDRFGETIILQDYGPAGTVGVGNAAADTAAFQAAVAALSPVGGTIVLRHLYSGGAGGLYLNQTITINKPVKLLGENINYATAIICQMSGPAILLSNPSLAGEQFSFEVENIRFVAYNATGPTEAAIKVSVGPSPSCVLPTFIGRNLFVTNYGGPAARASPYAQSFTNGIEFVPTTVSDGSGTHCFWNVALYDVTIIGSDDSATSRPITGTHGITYGSMISGAFFNVNVLHMDTAWYQTGYAEAPQWVVGQAVTCAHGFTQASFASVGPSKVKLLTPFMQDICIATSTDSIVLSDVYGGIFVGNNITATGTNNVVLTDSFISQFTGNLVAGGTIGVSLLHGPDNEGGNYVAGNVIYNCTTQVSLGTGTAYDAVINNTPGAGALPSVTNSGTNNAVLAVSGAGMTSSVPIGMPTQGGLIAAGSTQGTALALTAPYSNVSTVAAGTGVILPVNAVTGSRWLIWNHGTNALLVYPPVGHGILGTSTVSVGAGAKAVLIYFGGATWIQED